MPIAAQRGCRLVVLGVVATGAEYLRGPSFDLSSASPQTARSHPSRLVRDLTFECGGPSCPRDPPLSHANQYPGVITYSRGAPYYCTADIRLMVGPSCPKLTICMLRSSPIHNRLIRAGIRLLTLTLTSSSLALPPSSCLRTTLECPDTKNAESFWERWPTRLVVLRCRQLQCHPQLILWRVTEEELDDGRSPETDSAPSSCASPEASAADALELSKVASSLPCLPSLLKYKRAS